MLITDWEASSLQDVEQIGGSRDAEARLGKFAESVPFRMHYQAISRDKHANLRLHRDRN